MSALARDMIKTDVYSYAHSLGSVQYIIVQLYASTRYASYTKCVC